MYVQKSMGDRNVAAPEALTLVVRVMLMLAPAAAMRGVRSAQLVNERPVFWCGRSLACTAKARDAGRESAAVPPAT